MRAGGGGLRVAREEPGAGVGGLAEAPEPELSRANVTGLVLGCIAAKFCK